MKGLREILIALVVVAGLSLSVSAQKGGKKPTPPKKDPPVVTPHPKNPPRDDRPSRPKKSSYGFVIWKQKTSDEA